MCIFHGIYCRRPTLLDCTWTYHCWLQALSRSYAIYYASRHDNLCFYSLFCFVILLHYNHIPPFVLQCGSNKPVGDTCTCVILSGFTIFVYCSIFSLFAIYSTCGFRWWWSLKTISFWQIFRDSETPQCLINFCLHGNISLSMFSPLTWIRWFLFSFNKERSK